jgi:hypothetical protein
MPEPEEILNGLQTIVTDYPVFAIIWHVVIYLLLIALIFRWQPSNKVLGALLCIPLLSVAVFAWLTGNPFTGTLFTVAAILLLLFGLGASVQPVALSRLPFIVIGILMIVFGLVYPHFLRPGSIIEYLYASPAGLIPCPTLSVLIGLVLLLNGFGSRTITLSFIVLGLFYGVFGVFRLGVYLDAGLLIGTIALLVQYLLPIKTPAG